MKYMALLYGDFSQDPEPGTAEFAAMMEAYSAVNAAFEEAGVLAGGEALLPPETATTLRRRNGKVETMDGPFAESKEQLGGYYILECDNLDDALKYAAMIPAADDGTIEVRPLADLNPDNV